MRTESRKGRNTVLKKTPDGLGNQIYLDPSSTITPNYSKLGWLYLQLLKGQVSLDSQKRFTIPWEKIGKNIVDITKHVVIPLTSAKNWKIRLRYSSKKGIYKDMYEMKKKKVGNLDEEKTGTRGNKGKTQDNKRGEGIEARQQGKNRLKPVALLIAWQRGKNSTQPCCPT